MAHFVLVAGFWLNGSSWSVVVEALEGAGHSTDAVTLPGTESSDSDRSSVTLADHVDAIAASIDAAADAAADSARGESVVVVGHSAAAGLVYAAVDRRAARVSRVVYVGGFPTADGQAIGADLPAVDGEIPLLDWSEFDETEIFDLDGPAREKFSRDAVPFPQGVVTEPLQLTNPARFAVPVTVICPEFSPADVREWLDENESGLGELSLCRDLELVDLASGHWPQITTPDLLAKSLIDAGRAAR